MKCDKYTLVSLSVICTLNVIHFVLSCLCWYNNYEHRDIPLIRSVIFAKILNDLFIFYKLYICYVNLNHYLPPALYDYIKFGSNFSKIPMIPIFYTYYVINGSYNQIKLYDDSLMKILYLSHYHLSQLVFYSINILFVACMGCIMYIFINKIFTQNHTNIQRRLTKNEICSICLDTNCNYTTLCGHMFHFICIAQWIHTSKKYECPICRSNISYDGGSINDE